MRTRPPPERKEHAHRRRTGRAPRPTPQHPTRQTAELSPRRNKRAPRDTAGTSRQRRGAAHPRTEDENTATEETPPTAPTQPGRRERPSPTPHNTPAQHPQTHDATAPTARDRRDTAPEPDTGILTQSVERGALRRANPRVGADDPGKGSLAGAAEHSQPLPRSPLSRSLRCRGLRCRGRLACV